MLELATSKGEREIRFISIFIWSNPRSWTSNW